MRLFEIEEVVDYHEVPWYENRANKPTLVEKDPSLGVIMYACL